MYNTLTIRRLKPQHEETAQALANDGNGLMLVLILHMYPTMALVDTLSTLYTIL